MNTMDYDRALYFTHRQQWDNLLILMVETRDDFLAKKIEKFLYALIVKQNYFNVEKKVLCLLSYITHALKLENPNNEVSI